MTEMRDRTDALLRPSRLGKAGLACGIISLVLLGFFVVAVPIATARFASDEFSEPVSGWQVLAGVAFLGLVASPLMSVVGIVLGAAGLSGKNRLRGLSLAGLFVSLFSLLLFGLVCVLLGFWMEGLLAG